MSDLRDRVLGVVEHNTNNRVQGPTVKHSTVVQLIARHEHDPAQVNEAIATLVDDGELERTDDGKLRLS
jgi:hypothetical protein